MVSIAILLGCQSVVKEVETLSPTEVITQTAVAGMPTPVRTPTLASLATTTSVATALASPSPMSCEVMPMRGFGKVWYENAVVREYVGCPTYPRDERAMEGYTVQRFERGVMLRVEQAGFNWERGVILVLFQDDMTFARLSDTWKPGLPEPSPQVPPPGMHEPQGPFGKVWREGASVKDRLGWAIEPAKKGGSWSPDPVKALNGATQGFQRGVMYWIPYKAGTLDYLEDRLIYVLGTVGPTYGWSAFPDTWRD